MFALHKMISRAMKKFFLYTLSILFILEMQVQMTGCANIVPPSGGFRDSLPPVLEKANPGDSTRNFEGNKISLSFDEYVQVDNFQQNVIVSPIPRIAPTATYRLNTVSVRLRDTLEPNTTYSINFGNSIKDVNEGNLMNDFRYVFSTGPFIDSLSFSGNVILAETGKIDSSLVIILHTTADDSAVMLQRPRYMSKTDGKGNFVFRNLPPDTFYVYALKDDSRSFRYMGAKQLFAFADSPVVVQQNTARKQLYAYTGPTVPQTSAGSGAAGNLRDKRLKFQTSINNDKHDLLKKFSFQFERPLLRFDSSKVRFTTDTIYTPLRGHKWTIDSTKKIVTLNYSLQENTLYHFILEKDFATDTLGQQLLKGDTITFNTLKNSDYGKLSIRFRNLDLTKNPVLQFVQSDKVVNSSPMAGSTFSQPLFLPGEYELRILHDANKNGVWDPGEFFGKRKQPEIVKPITRQINVKENWDNEFDIDVPKG